MHKCIVGIDYSLTCPSITRYDPSKGPFCFENCQIEFLTSVKKYQDTFGNVLGKPQKDFKTSEQRFNQITQWALDNIREGDIIYMEGYSMGSVGRVFDLAENMGLLKHYLWKDHFEYFSVPPTVIKKFATGKGNANKDRLDEAFIKETGINIKELLNMTSKQTNPSSDIIDSFFICKYGFSNYGK